MFIESSLIMSVVSPVGTGQLSTGHWIMILDIARHAKKRSGQRGA
jgi:hypothetical protein